MVYTVVLVDDAVDLRTLIGLALRRDGRLKVVAEVGDGVAAIAAVEEHRPDLVLMDVSMPVMDGITATRRLKATFPDLCVVMFTGYADDRLEVESQDAGASAFMDKSVPLPELVDALVSVVDRHRPTI